MYHIYQNDVKLTMTGLDEAIELAEKIHQKIDELMSLVCEFDRLRLEMGIDIIRTPEQTVSSPEKSADQMRP